MKYVRIKSYYQSGQFTGTEHLYWGDNQVKALEWFRKDFPAHKDCILVAETIDGDDPKNEEYIRICNICGCIN